MVGSSATGAIEARSLRRTFKGGIEAVRDLDLTVSTGEVFGFLGPNGADATATEAALSGLPGLERVVAERDALALYVEDGASSIAEIVRRLDRDQVQVGAISVARPSLDDVFLQATGRRLQEEEAASPEEVAA